tara:strand:- start:1259 stop:1489 length:231 start_codon:yes stop_codon:yes gene_type:complete
MVDLVDRVVVVLLHHHLLVVLVTPHLIQTILNLKDLMVELVIITLQELVVAVVALVVLVRLPLAVGQNHQKQVMVV